MTTAMARSGEGYLWTPSGDTEGLTTEAVVPSTYDVVAIGAGLAGLTAARNIIQQGNLTVLIVEGSDRIGGRAWTTKASGEDFEMGGTWISVFVGSYRYDPFREPAPWKRYDHLTVR